MFGAAVSAHLGTKGPGAAAPIHVQVVNPRSGGWRQLRRHYHYMCLRPRRLLLRPGRATSRSTPPRQWGRGGRSLRTGSLPRPGDRRESQRFLILPAGFSTVWLTSAIISTNQGSKAAPAMREREAVVPPRRTINAGSRPQLGALDGEVGHRLNEAQVVGTRGTREVADF